MTSTKTRKWNRHLILAEIKSRFGTLNEFADTTPLKPSHFSVALARPYPKAEALIAHGLGIDAKELWPDRYRHSENPSDTHKPTPQNSGSHRQKGAAA
ncbi:helix-turn-helix domain-containing protein [Sneathiella sp.]|uniref:helix-turn-helix domain-containing protein n=1 Tax=Sneathiella sp. TaxID=1964365 RepID=UPI002FE321C3